jgi:hypothetical protein
MDVTRIDVGANTDVATIVDAGELDTGTYNRVELWEVLEANLPAAGSHDIKVWFSPGTMANNNDIGIIVAAYTGVTQAAKDVSTNVSQASTSYISGTVDAQVGDLMVSAVCNGSGGTYTHDANQTELEDIAPFSAGMAMTEELCTTAELSTIGHTATGAPSRNVMACAVFSPAAGVTALSRGLGRGINRGVLR